MSPLHTDHTGVSVGCNAFCNPAERIHTEVVYGEPLPPGQRVITDFGLAEVLVDDPASPEVPRSQHPNVIDREARVTTLRYEKDPLVQEASP